MLTTIARPARARLAQMRDTGSDAGITLTELLVTMVLMSIVSALALTWLVGSSASNAKTTNSSFTTGDARNALQSWPALLRVADAPVNGQVSLPASGSPTPAPTTVRSGRSLGRFLAISPTSITFNADIDNRGDACAVTCLRDATTQVTLSLSNGALVQTLLRNGTTNSITFVRNGADQVAGAGGTKLCLFTAYDALGSSLGCSAATPLRSVARVDIAFTVTPSNNGAPQTFQTSTAITGTLRTITPTATATAQ